MLYIAQCKALLGSVKRECTRKRNKQTKNRFHLKAYNNAKEMKRRLGCKKRDWLYNSFFPEYNAYTMIPNV